MVARVLAVQSLLWGSLLPVDILALTTNILDYSTKFSSKKLLVNAQSAGDGHLHSTMIMTNSFIMATGIFAVMFGATTVLSVQILDRATKDQCLNHAWPAARHEVHMAWCHQNGYKS